MLLSYYLDHVRLCCYLIILDHVRLCYYLVGMVFLVYGFFSPCVMVDSYVHASLIYISWRYICILTYSSHAHNEGEPNTNRNINILCILALIFVNADYLLQL